MSFLTDNKLDVMREFIREIRREPLLATATFFALAAFAFILLGLNETSSFQSFSSGFTLGSAPYAFGSVVQFRFLIFGLLCGIISEITFVRLINRREIGKKQLLLSYSVLHVSMLVLFVGIYGTSKLTEIQVMLLNPPRRYHFYYFPPEFTDSWTSGPNAWVVMLGVVLTFLSIFAIRSALQCKKGSEVSSSDPATEG